MNFKKACLAAALTLAGLSSAQAATWIWSYTGTGVTAAGTFLIVQGIFVVVNLIRGAEIHWFNIAFTLTLTMFAGMLGGLLGINLQKRGLVPKR